MNINKTDTLKKVSLNERLKLSSYISKIDSVAKSEAGETLGSVVSLVASSHTPVFIFTKENEFLGMISPYQVLSLDKDPYTTHVSSIVVNPPYITLNTALYDVAAYMLESRVYVLPIFTEEKQLSGAIHIKQIFQEILKDKELLDYISSIITSHDPVVAHSNSLVGDIYTLMHKKGVSRVVLVDDEGNLDGIVSRNDLLKAFMQPAPKERFGKNGVRPTDRAFDVEKEYRKDTPIKNFSTNIVHSIPVDTAQEEVIKKLLLSEHNCIVLVNKSNKPVGFISVRDILLGFDSLRPEEMVNIIVSNPSTNVSEIELAKAKELLLKFGQKMKKRIAIEKIEVNFEEPKYPTGGTSIFNTSIMISPVAGAKIISKTKNSDFISSIRSATSQIEKEQRRSGITWAQSKHTQR